MAYYPFTGNARDASGNGNHGTPFHAIPAADYFGKPNSAYYFNGKNAFIKVPDHSTLRTGKKISMCAWVKLTRFNTNLCYGNSILMKGDVEYEPGNYLMRISDIYTGCTENANTASEQFYGGTMGYSAKATTPVHTDQWYSLVCTYDGTALKFYVNCDLVATNEVRGLSFNNADPLFIGRTNITNYPYFFNGILDEIRIYNRVLNLKK